MMQNPPSTDASPSITWSRHMRTTVTIDDNLIAEAQRLSGLSERTALIHEGLRALIQRESARRLARLGGSEPRVQNRCGRRKAADPTG
jgi:Arc/MetJ family transcription regulator